MKDRRKDNNRWRKDDDRDGRNRFSDDKRSKSRSTGNDRRPFAKQFGPRPFRAERPEKDPNNAQEPSPEKMSAEGIRLNKYVANAGICARRKADEFIQAGHVQVNGETVKEPGYRVKEGEQVTFKGKRIQPNVEKVYILLNKPTNVITTTGDPERRKTVIDIVKKATPHRVYPVGRLDRDTMGLLLITNDGDLAKKLSHPSHGVKKIYYVVLDKVFSEVDFQKVINRQVVLEDGLAVVDGFEYVDGGDGTELGIEIHIGKNRFIRRLFEHLGYEVKKLDRVYYGGLTKKDLPRGKFRHLTREEIVMLKHFKS